MAFGCNWNIAGSDTRYVKFSKPLLCFTCDEVFLEYSHFTVYHLALFVRGNGFQHIDFDARALSVYQEQAGKVCC